MSNTNHNIFTEIALHMPLGHTSPSITFEHYVKPDLRDVEENFVSPWMVAGAIGNIYTNRRSGRCNV